MHTVKNLTLVLTLIGAGLFTGAGLLRSVEAAPMNPGVTPAPEKPQSAAPATLPSDVSTKQDATPDAAQCPNYADTNNDGVCDNRASCSEGKGRGGGYADADGDGVCDNQGAGTCRQGNGQGRMRRGQADANSNGICDNQGAGRQRSRQEHGQGRRKGHGQDNR